LGIKEPEDVEETVAANTLGTVIHNTLEDLYKPFEGKMLTVKDVDVMKSKIESIIFSHFKKVYKDGNIKTGKNLIIYEISKRYISNFLNKEIEYLKAGNQIKIIKVEAELKVEVNITGISFPVTLTGKVDRIDECNDITRIIDYKTGKVERNKVEIVNWEDITSDYTKYSKSFQLLMYAYMMHYESPITYPVEAGIISFKNLNSALLKFAKKDRTGPYAKKETLISQDTLNCFSAELKKLIVEICDPDTPFTEKEV